MESHILEATTETIKQRRARRKEEREDLDLLMRAIKAVRSSAVNTEEYSVNDIFNNRKSQEKFCHLVTPTKGITSETFDIKGMPAEWTRPEQPHVRKQVIMYCHGGGYTCGTLSYARIIAGKLAIHTGLEVLSFEYRLAPENPYPAAIEDSILVWNYLMHLGYGARDVILAGDSAGGNLALELTLHLKAEKRMVPAALILMSPWTDMSMTGKSYVTYKDKDPVVSIEYIKTVRQAYLGDNLLDFKAPQLSPVYADLKLLPPMLVQVGSNEILRSDSERLVKKVQDDGGYGVLQVYKGGWHVFQQMPVHNASLAMEAIARFLEGLLRY